MSLRGFNYLHRSRILTLVLILTLTSMLFLVTAFSFLGFYDGFTGYIGESENVVALYGTKGSTPLTALVPTYLAEDVSRLAGVLASSPEVLAPVTVVDKAVFVRGIATEEFCKLNNLTILQGDMLGMDDGYAAVVGDDLARRLDLKVGDKFVVFGVISQAYAELQIKGIFQSNSVMDDEILVPLYVGQWLRGAGYNYVSLIRVKLDYGVTNVDAIYGELTRNASSSPSLSPSPSSSPSGAGQVSLNDLIPYTKIGLKLGDFGIKGTQGLMQEYLNGYGVTKNTLIILSVVVLVFASGTAVCALVMFVEQHKRELGVIRVIGASERRVKFDLIVKVLSWSLVSSVLGVVLAFGVLGVLNQVGYLQVLSHGVSLQLDPLLVVVNFVLLSLLVSVQILRSDVRQ